MRQIDWLRVTALSALVVGSSSCGKEDEGPAGPPANGGTGGSAPAAGGGSPASGGGVATGGSTGATTGGGSALGGQSGAPSAGSGGVSGGSPPASGGTQAGGGGAAARGGSGGTAATGTGGTATGGKGGAGNAGNAGSATGGSSGSAGSATGGAGGSGGGATSCSADLSRTNRMLVGKAIDELFVQKDITAADRYWSDPYYQHNPIAKSGFSTFRSLMSSIVSSASFSYQRLLTLAECDLAVVYGRYSQTGVIFDMFRVRDGKIIEHWDSDSNQASETAHLGALEEGTASAANRALFLDFSAQVLVGGATSQASTFLSSTYSEHHGTPAAGVNALTAFLAAENVTYSKVHHVIADGNFVFALSEGKRGSAAFGFYDLFRVEGGKLAEHWDSRRSVPSSTMSGLGIF